MRSILAENRRVALLREFEGGGLSMAELMLPGGAVLRVYQIHPTGGKAS
jgi:hypothetical protein